MDGGRVLRETLDGAGADSLAARNAVYVADVSGMPALVTRLFALPSMRKRPYRILLDRDGTATRELPQASGKVTVLRLEGLRITEVSYADTPGALRMALDAARDRP
jgi:hypothetical protein